MDDIILYNKNNAITIYISEIRREAFTKYIFFVSKNNLLLKRSLNVQIKLNIFIIS